MSSPHSRRQAIDFPKNTLTPPSKRKAGRPSYIYKTTARSPPTSPNSPAPKRSKSHTHSILYDSSSEESEDVEREKTQQLEDLGEESGGPDEEADSIAPYRSPSPADSPPSTNTSHRTALPTVVPSPSNSDSLDGFSFDRIAFESRESRQALAEIGGSYRAKEAIREQSQPDPHHFRPLSELVHRAIVKDGFLSGGTPLNRISSSYSTAEFPIRDIPRFFDQQVSAYLSSHAVRSSGPAP